MKTIRTDRAGGMLAVFAAAGAIAFAVYFLITAFGWDVSSTQIGKIMLLSLWFAADHAKPIVVGMAVAATFAVRLWRKAA